MHFGGLEDDRKDSTAPHITLRPQLGAHRQCGLAIYTFHLGFSLGTPDKCKPQKREVRNFLEAVSVKGGGKAYHCGGEKPYHQDNGLRL